MATNNTQNTENALPATIRSSELPTIVAEFAEIGIDTMISEGFLKELPIFSTIIGGMKTFDSIKDYLYRKKIVSFLESLNSIPQSELIELISKLESDEKEKTKAGENILLIIERLDNMNKPKILGNMFLDYVKNNITKEDFFLLAQALDTFNLVYIPQFIDYFQHHNENISFPAKQHFGLCGLASIILSNGAIGNGGGYGRSELGILFLKYISE